MGPVARAASGSAYLGGSFPLASDLFLSDYVACSTASPAWHSGYAFRALFRSTALCTAHVAGRVGTPNANALGARTNAELGLLELARPLVTLDVAETLGSWTSKGWEIVYWVVGSWASTRLGTTEI